LVRIQEVPPATDATEEIFEPTVTKVATPVANPPGGTFTTGQLVSLDTTTAGAKIYFTLISTDVIGTPSFGLLSAGVDTPTKDSTLYIDPIYLPLGTSATLKAIAVLSGWDDSDVMKEDYVVSAAPVPPVITTTALPSGTVGVAYSADLTATGTAPITWTVTSGDLPDGLTLDTATGAISGKPTTAETLTFTVQAENDAGSDEKEFTVIIAALEPPVITTTALPSGVVDKYYSATLAATGTAPITWTITSGGLPVGAKLNPATGNISSTSLFNGNSVYYDKNYDFSVTATNIAGSDTKAFTITVYDPDNSDGNDASGCLNSGVGSAAMFFVSLGAILAPRLRRSKK
jgi:hypothetical protein